MQYAVSETPIGVVQIPLKSISSGSIIVENWYPLKIFGRMTKVSGEVHLRMKFNRGIKNSAPLNIKDDAPNELRIVVHAARHLNFADTLFCGVSCNPQVKLELDTFEPYVTNYVPNNMNPNFKDQEFVFSGVKNPGLWLNITVEDHKDINLFPDVLGRVKLPLRDFDSKKVIRNWYPLKSKTLNTDGVYRGEVDLSIHWQKKTFCVKVAYYYCLILND